MEQAYAELGCCEADSDETIKSIYRALARTFHPDRYARCGDLSQREKTRRFAE